MKYQILSILAIFSFQLTGQNLWEEVNINSIDVSKAQETRVLPSEYKTFKAEYDLLKEAVQNAPSEDISINMVSTEIMELPMPDGSLKAFKVYDSPTMQAGISAKYPEIKSYKGVAVEDPRTTVRFDYGYRGFHAAIHGPEGVFYIDPYVVDNKSYYLTYNVKHDVNSHPEGIPSCGVDHTAEAPAPTTKQGDESRTDVIPLRIYRIAIACTGEFGAWKGTVENAMSDINTSVNRINQIFENEASIRYVLVDRNDELLNFDASTDPYPNTNSGGAMLSVNTAAISTRIGVNSYDLGHVYSRSCDVGGIAALGSHCDNNKGAGVTCHYTSNLDFIASQVVSHEIGHQMSAQHTFNHCDNENETLGNGFEPGSGSTIMSYAGGCGIQNVVSDGDDYYHTGSLIQIYNHTRESIANDCGTREDFGNHEPEITLPELYETDLWIPRETYFYLEGDATDEDGDILTYAWDPMNTGPLSNLGTPLGEAPHFRSYPPSEQQHLRYFPRTQDIFTGSETSVEVLPAGGLTMRFNFTARDNNPNGGTAVWKEMQFKTAQTEEKFGITSQAEPGVSLSMGAELEVTWEVAGTDKAPVNCPFVDLYYTTTTSNLFDINDLTPLALCVPNDGSHFIKLPNIETNRGRIIIKARDNIFFDINPIGFQVLEPTEPTLYANTDIVCEKVCLPSVLSIEVETAAYGMDAGPVSIDVEGLPDGTIITYDNDNPTAGETVNVTLDFSDVLVTELLNPSIVVSDETGAIPFSRELTLDFVASDFSALTPNSPATGTSNVSVSPLFEWTPSPFADTYDFELSDSPSFDNIIVAESSIEDTDYPLDLILAKSTVYYWRVRASNSCSIGDYSKTQAFSTAVFACETIEAGNLPLNITQSGAPTIEAEFNVFTAGEVADVNIPIMRGDHTRNKDLFVSIISPNGTEVDLFGNICQQQNFRCGFDDESNTPVKCPLSQGDIYQPSGSLADLNGEQSQGVWKLKIFDSKPGNGGQLAEATLELCSNVSVANPVLVNLTQVNAPTNETTKIRSWNIKVEDEDNSAEELVYRVVSTPALGDLSINGVVQQIGDKFSQMDINAQRLDYKARDIEGLDDASFVVEDGSGGWVGVLDLVIEVNGNFSTATEDISEAIELYPNPASNYINVKTSVELSNVELVDIQGKLIRTIPTLRDGDKINVNNLQTGIYIIKASNETTSFSKRIVVNK